MKLNIQYVELESDDATPVGNRNKIKLNDKNHTNLPFTFNGNISEDIIHGMTLQIQCYQ